MSAIKNSLRTLLAIMLLSTLCATMQAQEEIKLDTIECHIIGFDVGTILPSAKASFATTNQGDRNTDATMASLYKGGWLNFGINTFYKYKNNWLVALDGDIWFGSDNLKQREKRMNNIFTTDGIIIGTNGTDAVVTAYNRGLAFKGGAGKIIPFCPRRNPNSGLLLRASAGWVQQQTIFMLNEVNAPQVDGDYALLYDHQRSGFILSEALGVWYMSNFANLVNCYITFEVSECWTRSTRDCTIDNLLGLSGKDNNRYFDLLYSLKLCWMFPLKGKTAKEYYYY